MEGGNAADRAGRTDEAGQGEPKRESSPSSPDKTARSDEESSLPFGLGKGYVELKEVERPEQMMPAKATKVARPNQKAPREAAQSQDNFDLDTGVTEQASPATVVMSPGSQAQVARWKVQSLLPKIVPPGHEPVISQRRIVPPITAAIPLSGKPMSPIVNAAMPSAPEETMMLCPQGISPVPYESGKGRAATSLMSLGNVTTSSHGANHGFPKSKEVFTDIVMEEALEDGGEDLQRMLEDEKSIHRQSPSPLRDLYEENTNYSSEDSTEVFTTEKIFNARFFEPQEQFDNGAQAQYEAPLQQEYWIPQTYCQPEVYFKNLEADVQFAYYNRPCSVLEYYELVCSDTPGYDKGHVKDQHNRASFRPAARQPTTSASSTRPVAHNPGFQRPHDPPPEFDEDEALARWRKGLLPSTQSGNGVE
jgi:hypothetical protein